MHSPVDASGDKWAEEGGGGGGRRGGGEGMTVPRQLLHYSRYC